MNFLRISLNNLSSFQMEDKDSLLYINLIGHVAKLAKAPGLHPENT